jgi:hypothetical protein
MEGKVLCQYLPGGIENRHKNLSRKSQSLGRDLNSKIMMNTGGLRSKSSELIYRFERHHNPSHTLKLGYDFIQGSGEIVLLYTSVILTNEGSKSGFKKKHP